MEIPVADDAVWASDNRDKHVTVRLELWGEHVIRLRFHANPALKRRKPSRLGWVSYTVNSGHLRKSRQTPRANGSHS
jgi:hypothetical protein